MSLGISCKFSSRFETDETLNQWTHGAGFVASIPGGIWLLQAASRHNDVWLTAGCAIFAVTLSLLYAASTLSHSVHRGIWRHRFRTFDQVCIFLFAAGSYTPFGFAYLREGWWGVLLVAMWSLALVGSLAKLFLTKFDNVAVWFYVLVGWVPILALPHFATCFGVDGVAWILIGAAAYSGGTWFLTNDERPFFHPVWHLCTLLGSTCHYFVVLNYVVGCAV